MESPQECCWTLLAFALGWFLSRVCFARMFLDKVTQISSNLHLVTSAGGKLLAPKSAVLRRDDLHSKEPSVHKDKVTAKKLPLKGTLQSPCPQLAKAYGQKGRPDLAADLWLHAAKEASCATTLPEPELYSTALEVCVDSFDFHSASRLARGACWQAPSSARGQAAFQCLARWLARRQDVLHATRCIEAVLHRGGHVGFATMQSLLIAYARSGQVEAAIKQLENISAAGFQPDTETFSAIIRSLCNAGEAGRAMSYLRKMLQSSLKPDIHLLNVVLEGGATNNSLPLVEDVMLTMKALSISPSNCTLAILVTFFSSRGDLELAISLFEDIPKKNKLEPDAQAFSALISACCRHGRTELAWESYKHMKAVGIKPGVLAVETLIQSCMRIGALNQAVDLVDEAICQKASESSPRICIAKTLIEELLVLLGRRRKALHLGLPLVQRLLAAHLEVRENVAEAMLQAAIQEQALQTETHTRDRSYQGHSRSRSELQEWRRSFNAPLREGAVCHVVRADVGLALS